MLCSEVRQYNLGFRLSYTGTGAMGFILTGPFILGLGTRLVIDWWAGYQGLG